MQDDNQTSDISLQTSDDTVVEQTQVNTESDVTEESQNSDVVPAEAGTQDPSANNQDESGSPIESGMTTETAVTKETPSEEAQPSEETGDNQTSDSLEAEASELDSDAQTLAEPIADDSPARWYVVHTYSGHENRVSDTLKQKVESQGLENKILEVLVPTQDKIEIKGGKKETIKEKIFPGYIIVKMILDDDSWLAVRTTQGVTSFVGMGNKPTPIPEHEVRSIVQFMSQGAAPTYKTVFNDGDTVKIVDGPFSEFIGKIESVDREKGKVRVLVSIFGRETPVELDFLQVQKL